MARIVRYGTVSEGFATRAPSGLFWTVTCMAVGLILACFTLGMLLAYNHLPNAEVRCV